MLIRYLDIQIHYRYCYLNPELFFKFSKKIVQSKILSFLILSFDKTEQKFVETHFPLWIRLVQAALIKQNSMLILMVFSDRSMGRSQRLTFSY